MAIKKDDLDIFFEHITKTLFKYDIEDFPKYFRNSYLAGDNVLYQKNISETKMFDDEWIVTLESYFPSIDRITRNPRSFIKYEDDIVDVERAKKITSKTIQHLASHSQYVRDVDKNENVTPSKVLTIYSDTDYDTYENRFLATLINRLFLFTRNRLEVIRANVESFQKDHFKINSKFDIADSEVDMEINLSIKRDLDNKTINEHNYDLLERVEKLSMLIDGLKGSQFMQIMKKSKPVHPPIMKTNVILKNADFRNAYTLWLFMDKYSTLGYDVEVKEKDLEFDNKFKKYVDELVLVNFTTVLANQLRRQRKYKAAEYETYTKKRKKTSRKDASDFVDNPDLIQVEDNSLNEYFLNRYKKLFNQTVTEMEQDGEVLHDEAIRRAIRKATDIVNGLFESVFRLEEENDVFRQLVEKEDINKDYEIKRNQLKYAKIIREVKEVDFNKAIRQEKRLIKELEKINTKYIKEKIQEKANAEKAPIIAQLEVDIKRLQAENKEYEKRIAALENMDVLRKDEKDNIKTVRDEALNRARNEIRAFENELQRKENEEKVAKRKALRAEQKENDLVRSREEKAAIARQNKIDKMIENETGKIIRELEKEKASLSKKLDAKLAKERAAMEKARAIEEERIRRQREIEEQRERERIAVLKVKAYEKRIELEAEIKKLKSAV